MTDPRGKWVVWAIAGMTLVMITGGLIVTGGPVQGQKERRDNVRRNDLAALYQHARCISASEQRNDGDLSATSHCPDEPRLIDPYSGEAYDIEPLQDRHLRLCARFEISADDMRRRRGGPPGEWADDCIVVQLTYD